MKKIKQIDTYYCDYCLKECQHTEKYVLPVLGNSRKSAFDSRGAEVMRLYFEEPKPRQVDICPECQAKIAIGLKNIMSFMKKTDNGYEFVMPESE